MCRDLATKTLAVQGGLHFYCESATTSCESIGGFCRVSSFCQPGVMVIWVDTAVANTGLSGGLSGSQGPASRFLTSKLPPPVLNRRCALEDDNTRRALAAN